MDSKASLFPNKLALIGEHRHESLCMTFVACIFSSLLSYYAIVRMKYFCHSAKNGQPKVKYWRQRQGAALNGPIESRNGDR